MRAEQTALKNKKASSEKKAHWMDFYMDTHECDTDPKCSKTKCQKVLPTLESQGGTAKKGGI